MFGFFKKRKKAAERDAFVTPEVTRSEPPNAFSEPYYLDKEESGYFLNEKDIKVIVKACVFFVKNGFDGGEAIVERIPETGGKLRDKSDLSPDDITVISICLQAYNNEVCKVISEHESTDSPDMFRLRKEKVYFLTIIEKLTNYLTVR
jgi:hypothetical protein